MEREPSNQIRWIWNDCDASLGSVFLHDFDNQMATFHLFLR